MKKVEEFVVLEGAFKPILLQLDEELEVDKLGWYQKLRLLCRGKFIVI